MLNSNDRSWHDLEQLLDDAGEAFRDRAVNQPPEAPESFVEAVRAIGIGADRAPALRVRSVAAVIALAACMALVVTVIRYPGSSQTPLLTDPTGRPAMRSLNPLSAGALRLRNLDRSIEDSDLPDASIVHWVTRTNPLGP